MKRHDTLLLSLIPIMAALSACSPKTPEQHISNAEKYIQSSNSKAAIIELKSALVDYPKLSEARLMLGNLYFQNGDLPSAEKELNRALDEGADINKVMPILVQVLYHSEQFDALINAANNNTPTEETAKSTVLLFKFIAALRSQNEPGNSIASKPKDGLTANDNTLAEAYLAFAENRLPAAKVFLEELQSAKYRPEMVLFLLGTIDSKEGNLDAAVEHISQVKQLVPAYNSVDFQLIELMIRAKQYEQAEKKTDELLKTNKNNPVLNLYKANINYQKENYKIALASAEKSIQNGLDSLMARMIAGVSAYRLENLEVAYRHLINLNQRDGFKDPKIQRFLAHVQLSLGNNTEALETLKSIDDLTKEDSELIAATGMKLASVGDIKNANQLMEMAKKLDADNITYKMREAMMNANTNENIVIENLQDVIETDPTFSQGWMRLAMAHLRNNDKESALKIAKDWAEKKPEDGKTLEGVIYFNTNEPEKAIAALQSALEINPIHIGANHYLLQAYAQNKQYDQLWNLAQKIITFSPNDMPALMALVGASKELSNQQELESLLKRLSADNDNAIEPLVALAVDARSSGHPEEAINILSKLEKLNTLGFVTLGDTYIQTGQVDNAISTYQHWQQAYPSVTARLREIGVYELQKNDQLALEKTLDALKVYPSNLKLKLLKLNFLTKLQRIDQAKLALKDIQQYQTAEKSDALNYYEGHLALREKDYAKAELLLSKYHKQSPSYSSATLLAKAMIGNRNIDGAKQILENQLAQSADDAPTTFKTVVADFYSFNKMYAKAAELYQSILQTNGENFALLNNIAYNRLQAGQIDEAKTAAKKALNLAPNTPEIIDTMGWVEFKSGNLDEAYRLISSALKLKPDSVDVNLHLAEVLIELNQDKNAREILNKLPLLTAAQQQTKQRLLDKTSK